MPHPDWSIRAATFGSCSCDYACPCQFESKPTRGHCQSFEAAEIEEGHYGTVRLDGLRYVLIYAWPGPVYEGNGTGQIVIDERATPEQRDALLRVLSGEDTEPGTTHWWVFRQTTSRMAEPLSRPIDLRVDIEARTARVSVSGVLESTGRPIRSPVTGEEHRVRIDLPNGIEFRIAEIGSADTRSLGAIPFDLTDTYGQFNRVHHTPRGPAS